MSHLGDNLSALVDGELSGSDLDRANAHLASCDRCRGEAAALRVLKRDLRALVEQATSDDLLTSRLLSMAARPGRQARLDEQPESDEPLFLDELLDEEGTMRALSPRPAFRMYEAGLECKPQRSPRHRYLMWGALSLAFVGGLSAAAFTVGGSSSAGTGPGVVPQVELFNVEHAIDSGYVPFPDVSPATKQVVQQKP